MKMLIIGIVFLSLAVSAAVYPYFAVKSHADKLKRELSAAQQTYDPKAARQRIIAGFEQWQESKEKLSLYLEAKELRNIDDAFLTLRLSAEYDPALSEALLKKCEYLLDDSVHSMLPSVGALY